MKGLNRFLTLAQLFLGSYCLLFALLAVKFTEWVPSLVCAVIAALGFTSSVAFLMVAERRATSEVSISLVVDKGSDIGAYILTYILPFLTASQPTMRDLLTYAIFLCVVVLIYARSGLLFINPLFYVFGYAIYGITMADTGELAYIVSQERPADNSIINAARMLSSVYIKP